MKRCPECRHVETDDTLTFCRADGTPLVRESGEANEGAGTLQFGSAPAASDTETRLLPQARAAPPADEAIQRPVAATTVLDTHRVSDGARKSSKRKASLVGVIVAALAVALTVVGFAYYSLSRKSTRAIDSLAVLPFQNASGDPNLEYLSDGVTESLINSLSQLPNLAVKARSTVFRYKGKETEPQKVGSDLNVQAVLNGRLMQRGDDLILSLDLVDTRTGNQVWGGQYNRKLSDLVTLQGEIARDVSNKLRVKLSGADERKLAKTHTASPEAYRLYLKGHYHLSKLMLPDTRQGISYFQQAIEVDPSYALAFAGLADGYRVIAIAGEMRSTDFLQKSKAAALKAVEIDDTLAEAHASLGFTIFWYDWDWNAAENQFKLALELNPNSPDARQHYAHLLSNTGRHAEALSEIKRARELDPLSLRINALEGQFLLHAGDPDEALARFQKAFELDPNYWFAHMFASSAYIEKGMFDEAIGEARKAREFSGGITITMAFLGYALAKSGEPVEAQAVLTEILKIRKKRYVPPYNIALVYNALDERDKVIDLLEQGYQERDPKMVFLKVEPKWNNLRSDTRFAELMRKVGFPP